MSLSFASSSVRSAVISFVVEPTESRLSAARAQATMPVSTSMTIALWAPTDVRARGRARRLSGRGEAEEERRHDDGGADAPHSVSRIR